MGKKAKVLKHQIKKKRKRIRNEKRQVRKNIAKFEKTGEFERQQEEIIRKRRKLRENYLKTLKDGDIKETEFISSQIIKFEIYRKLERDKQEEISI